KVASGDEKLITTAARDRLSSFELKYKNLSNNGTLALFKMIKESYSEDDFERFIEMLKEDIDKFEISKEHKKLVQDEEKHSPFFYMDQCFFYFKLFLIFNVSSSFLSSSFCSIQRLLF